MPHPRDFSESHFAKKFAAGQLEHKMHWKTSLQEELGWPREPRRPLLCFPAGMTDSLGGSLLQEILPGLLSEPIEILILGKGSATYGKLFTRLAKEHSHRMHIVPQEPSTTEQMYAASDMAMFLSDIPMKELSHGLDHGVIPVSVPMPSLEDYNPVQETGNAFVFDPPTTWHCFAALIRAIETYKFPFDWRTIQRHCLDTARKR